MQHNTDDMRGTISKNRCVCLHSQHEGGGSKVSFNNNKRKLVPKHRRFFKEEMLSMMVSSICSSLEDTNCEEVIMMDTNPGNSTNKCNKHVLSHSVSTNIGESFLLYEGCIQGTFLLSSDNLHWI